MTKEYTETNINDVAKVITKSLQPGWIYTFEGGLAAGKTTLIRAIMRELGYEKTVNSPTFVIEHRYKLSHKNISEVLHLDLYRLKPEDLANLDWDEYARPDTLTFVEWPAIANKHLPKRVKELTIEIINDKTRRITLPDSFSD